VFFIDTDTGQVATGRQLFNAGIAREDGSVGKPWHRIQGPSDASTLWYAVLRKRSHGVFIGTLSIRHGGHHASLLEQGWEEIPVEEIRASGEDAVRGGET
jgi:hypothetical protein